MFQPLALIVNQKLRKSLAFRDIFELGPGERNFQEVFSPTSLLLELAVAPLNCLYLCPDKPQHNKICSFLQQTETNDGRV